MLMLMLMLILLILLVEVVRMGWWEIHYKNGATSD
jgi:hypothetical protein